MVHLYITCLCYIIVDVSASIIDVNAFVTPRHLARSEVINVRVCMCACGCDREQLVYGFGSLKVVSTSALAVWQTATSCTLFTNAVTFVM